MAERAPDRKAARNNPGKTRRLRLGINDGYREAVEQRVAADPFETVTERSRRELGAASGIDTVEKSLPPKDKKGRKELRERAQNRKTRGNYLQRNQRLRRNDKRRLARNSKAIVSKLAGAVTKSKGNVAGAAWNLLKDKEVRRLLGKYKFELGVGILAFGTDFIPIIGFVLDILWWCIIWILFKSKGVDFWGKVTKGQFGLMNIGIEIVMSATFAYPGLLMGVVMTILQSEELNNSNS